MSYSYQPAASFQDLSNSSGNKMTGLQAPDPKLERYEMDKSDMQRSVESLRNQLNIERTPISQSATAMRQFTENQEDPLVNPIDKKVNPWAEKSKCSVL